MPKRKKPDHISQEDWDAVDIPPITDEMAAKLRPVAETHPEILEAYRRRKGRGAQKAPTKQWVGIRLDQEVVRAYKADGPGWQSRINEDLKDLVERRARKTG